MEDQVSFAVFAAGFVAAHLASGRVKGLAVLGAEPEGATLGVAGLTAQGFGELEVQGWSGLFVGRGVPASVVDEYESLIRAYVHSPDGRAAMRRNWQNVDYVGGARAEALVARDSERYRAIFRRLRIV
jgi:tripartite-type tricarboxylate transporter receptor subunit TctC